MTPDELMKLREEHPFLEAFEPRDVARLARLATDVRYDRGAVIFREGDDCKQFHLIVSGRVGLEMTVLGRKVLIQTLNSGDELGWSAMLMSEGRHFQARALGPVHLLSFDSGDLLKACEAEPRFGLAFMWRLVGVVSQRLQATRLQLLDIYASAPR